ncbi:hypothetical protein CTATCC11996_22877 [Comamonas testosteroni ATCC 11996]|nr:hypothetical protein CTATCC11996_22877 [Comamonas testosteroni ATCC 11996]
MWLLLHHLVDVSLLRTMGTMVTATEVTTTTIVGDAMATNRGAGITTEARDPTGPTDGRMTVGGRSTDHRGCGAE